MCCADDGSERAHATESGLRPTRGEWGTPLSEVVATPVPRSADAKAPKEGDLDGVEHGPPAAQTDSVATTAAGASAGTTHPRRTSAAIEPLAEA